VAARRTLAYSALIDKPMHCPQEPAMNRTTHRLVSLAAAALLTVVMLAGVDRLATSDPAPELLARVTATAGT